jgi:hypothetical protein
MRKNTLFWRAAREGERARERPLDLNPTEILRESD